MSGAGSAVGQARPEVRLAATLVAVAALSALLIAPAPSYDPWAWLLWGREIAHGTLSTAEGPAFKPLAVAVATLLAPLGGAAPETFVILGRLGMLVAVVLGFRLGREYAGLAGGLAAAVGVACTGNLIGYSAAGAEPGWTIALALGAVEAWRGGRPRLALALGVGCALLRVEAWPFLALFGVHVWRTRPQDRPLLIAAAVAIPALWFIPELLGSGDLLRSGARARMPNPGQPATTAVPAFAALKEAAVLPLWPLWIGALLAPRAARPLLFAGLAWIALVAVMAQAGFSGEPRYALPGAALVAIAGAAGWRRACGRSSSRCCSLSRWSRRRSSSPISQRTRPTLAAWPPTWWPRSTPRVVATPCSTAAAPTSGCCAARSSPTTSTWRSGACSSSRSLPAWCSARVWRPRIRSSRPSARRSGRGRGSGAGRSAQFVRFT